MEGKARYIFPVMISALIVFVVSPYSRSSQLHTFAAQPMRSCE